jgi:hypothetical protein
VATNNQFTVSIQGIELTATQKRSLNSAIQRAALSELAGLGIKAPLGTHFPREWLGIWIGPIKSFDQRAIEAGPVVKATRVGR